MKQFLFIVLLYFSILPLRAQKDVVQSIDASAVEVIEIDSDEVYKIHLKTSENTGKIKFSTHSEGEYFNNIFLETSMVGRRLILNSQYPQSYAGGFDKLSAHKVFSIEVDMEIPNNMQVLIVSNIASVIAEGDFKYFEADLKQGFCNLVNFTGNATINTYVGDIRVSTNFAKVEAKTRSGSLNLSNLNKGINLLKLNSINGDITVLKN